LLIEIKIGQKGNVEENRHILVDVRTNTS